MLKTNENGRSMVEMLGVLAIIGVLSVAGIAGYSMAMKRYRANEVVGVASTFYMLAEANKESNPAGSSFGGGSSGSLADVGLEKVFGTIDMEYDGDGHITVKNAGALCDIITNIVGTGGDFTISNCSS